MTDSNHGVSIDELLSHAGWVRALAFHLVHNDADADDITQKAWVAALESPPTERHAVKAWFRKVLANFARESHRTRQSRVAREAATARSEVDADQTELVARVEAQRTVAGLVLELDEPYRRCVLLRFFENLPPREIAARLGVSVETIHSQLQRAKTQLRTKLERRNGKDWAAALVPLLNWPPPVPTPGSPPLSPLSPISGIPAKALLALGVGVLGATGVWYLWRDGSGAAAEGAGMSDVASDRAESGVASASSSPRGRGDRPWATPPIDGKAADASQDPADGQDSTQTVTVEGTVRTESGAEVEGGYSLVVTPLTNSESRPMGSKRTFELTASRFRIDLGAFDDGLRVAEWALTLDHPGYLPESVRVLAPPSTTGRPPVEAPAILLRLAAFVTGTVTWTDPAAGSTATVGTVTADGRPRQVCESAEVAPSGRFRLRAIPGKPMLLAVATAGRVPAVREFNLSAGAEWDAGVVALEPGVRISGRVVCTQAPLEGPIWLWTTSLRETDLRLGGHYIDYENGVARRYGGQFPLDAEGRFAIDGLSPGAFRIEPNVSSKVAGDVLEAAVTVVAAPSDGVEVVLDGGVVGLLVRDEGHGVQDAVFTAEPRHGVQAQGRTDANGVARFVGTPGQSYCVRVVATGFEPRTETIAAPAQGSVAFTTVELVREPAGAEWIVTLRDARGRPPSVAGFGFQVAQPGKPSVRPKFVRNVTGEDGVFRVAGITPGRWRVEIRPGSEWNETTGFAIAPTVEREFSSGARLEDVLDVAPAGRLVVTASTSDGRVAESCVCRVLDATGAPVRVVFKARSTIGHQESANGLSLGPTDVYPALPPGNYAIDCELPMLPGKPRKSVTVEVRAGEVTEAKVVFDP